MPDAGPMRGEARRGTGRLRLSRDAGFASGRRAPATGYCTVEGWIDNRLRPGTRLSAAGPAGVHASYLRLWPDERWVATAALDVEPCGRRSPAAWRISGTIAVRSLLSGRYPAAFFTKISAGGDRLVYSGVVTSIQCLCVEAEHQRQLCGPGGPSWAGPLPKSEIHWRLMPSVRSGSPASRLRRISRIRRAGRGPRLHRRAGFFRIETVLRGTLSRRCNFEVDCGGERRRPACVWPDGNRLDNRAGQSASAADIRRVECRQRSRGQPRDWWGSYLHLWSSHRAGSACRDRPRQLG
jgi:hypothetical protein